MPAIGFNCEAGQISFSECLKECPLGNRCLSRPTLNELSKVRVWNGKPSTTQLLIGTREAYLSIKHNFYIDPMEQSFRLIGQGTHALLEKNIGSNEIGEHRFEEEGESGQGDLYDGDDETLYDYKVLGSYKVAIILGMDYTEEEDPSGRVLKSGKNKGEVAKIKKWFENPKIADNWEYAMQINRYRIMHENAGLKVSRMRMQVTVRDGNTFTAKGRGIDKSVYMIDIPKIYDVTVMSYFTAKSIMLINSLDTNTIPEKCSDRECWDGTKCESYCNVRGFCNGHS